MQCDGGLMGDSDSDSDAELTKRSKRTANGFATRGRADDTSSEDESSSDEEEAPRRGIAFGLTEDLEDDSPVSSPASVTWREVTLSYRYSGSVADLKEHPEKATLLLQNEKANVFGEWGGDRTKNHICGGVDIVGLKNNFPVSLQIYADGAAGNDARTSVSCDCTRGAFTAWPKMDFNGEGDNSVALIARNSEADQHPFLKKYPGWNLDNVENGITHISEVKTVIQNDHPIVGVFNRARIATGKAPLTSKNEQPAGFFTAIRADVGPALERVKAMMTNKLQFQDMHNLSVRFSRAFGNNAAAGGGAAPADNEEDAAPAWDDPVELFEGLSNPTSKKAALNEPCSLYVKLRVRYRVI